jgi:Holliday junction DNA helicase RuvB
VNEISQIIHNNSHLLELYLSDSTIQLISKRSRGTPRIANRLLKIVRDYKTIGKNVSDPVIMEEIFIDI